MADPLNDRRIVSEEEWVKARTELLKKEKEFTALRDQLSQQQRDLPWVAVDKEYVFEGKNGKQTLSELFDGRSQLLVYHFMFDSSWNAGCPSCSFLGRQFQWNNCAFESERCDHDRCFSCAIWQVGGIPKADGLGFQVGFLLRYRFQFRLSRVFHTGSVSQEGRFIQLY